MKFSIAAVSFQVLLLLLFGTLTRYDPDQSGPVQNEKPRTSNDIKLYPMFQDVHVMIFIGFGFLMSFLSRYGYGSVGYTFFTAIITAQWYIIVAGCLEHRGKTNFDIDLNLKSLITGDFAAATVLITFGVVVGTVSRLQLLIIGIIEIVIYAVNELILIKKLEIADAGGSLVIHCFGCYFGLALSWVMRRPTDIDDNPKETSVYHSDLFSMIGTIFLWLFWPSFNSVMVGDENDQQRTVINTYLSLAASCVTTFVVSALVNRERKLNMVHVQNATLAGGVAIGTLANMVIQPWGAILIGFLAAVICTLGITYVTPFLNKKFHLHDTCGVNNLHGMPSLLAGFGGVVAAAVANRDNYHDSLTNVFEAGRSPSEQAGYQALGILVTLTISIVSGAITGFIVKLKIFEPPTRDQMFEDEDFWEVTTSHLIFQGLLVGLLLIQMPEVNATIQNETSNYQSMSKPETRLL